jgi:hypothetical protein
MKSMVGGGSVRPPVDLVTQARYRSWWISPAASRGSKVSSGESPVFVVAAERFHPDYAADDHWRQEDRHRQPRTATYLKVPTYI